MRNKILRVTALKFVTKSKELLELVVGVMIIGSRTILVELDTSSKQMKLTFQSDIQRTCRILWLTAPELQSGIYLSCPRRWAIRN